MSHLLLTSKKNSWSLGIKWCPPVSGCNQRLVQKLLPCGWCVSPAPGVSHHPWAEAKPCQSLCLQNVHSSSCQLQTAVARELRKVKKTAKDEGRAAAEGWQAAAGEGGGEGEGRQEGQEKGRTKEPGLGIGPHLATEKQFPVSQALCFLIITKWLPLILFVCLFVFGCLFVCLF